MYVVCRRTLANIEFLMNKSITFIKYLDFVTRYAIRYYDWAVVVGEDDKDPRQEFV